MEIIGMVIRIDIISKRFILNEELKRTLAIIIR